jgi:hypothetical protein
VGKLGFVGGSVGSFGNRLGFSRVLIGNSQLCKPARGRTLKKQTAGIDNVRLCCCGTCVCPHSKSPEVLL